MKKLVFILMLTFSVSALFAQKKNVKEAEKALESMNLDDAKKFIELAIDGQDDEKTINDPETWLLRGKIFEAIIKNPTPRDKNVLQETYKSYVKTLQLGSKDPKFKYKDNVIARLKTLSDKFVVKADDKYEKKDFEKALELYQFRLKISTLPEIKNTDGAIKIKTGKAALNAEKYTLAISYFDEAISMKFETTKPYFYKAKVLKKQSKIDEYVNVLKTGIDVYPNDCGVLLLELVSYHEETGKQDEILKYLKTMEQKYPNNASVLATLGNFSDKMGDTDKAFEYCRKAVGLKPDAYETNYYIGRLYYNAALKHIADADKQNKAINAEVPKAIEQFKQAQPYLEKAYKINPDVVNAAQKLYTVYRKLKVWDKVILMKKHCDKLTGVKY